MLDCLGDLSLVGVPVLGHYYAYKPGHELNRRLMQKLFEARDTWSYITVNEFNALIGRGGQGMKPPRQRVSEVLRQQAAC